MCPKTLQVMWRHILPSGRKPSQTIVKAHGTFRELIEECGAARNTAKSLPEQLFMKLRYRSYRSVGKTNGLALACAPGLPRDSVRSFLPHYEGNGESLLET